MTPEGRRNLPALLLDARMGPYFVAGLVSSCGVWIHNIVSAIVVFEATGSATIVGLVSVLQFGPSLVLSPWVGVLADRVDRRLLLAGGQALGALSAATLAAVTWGRPISATPVLIAAGAIGVSNAVIGPAGQALIPALVPRADLDRALTLQSLTFNVARAVGPAIGAAALLALGPAPAFAFNGVTYALLAVVLLTIRPLHRPAPAPTGERSVRAGLRFVRDDAVVRRVLLASALAAVAVDPVVTLTPALAQSLDGRETLVGAMVSAFGIGSLATIPFLSTAKDRLGLRAASMAAFGAFATGLLLAAWATVPIAAIAAFGIAGTGFLAATTSLTGMLQRLAPDHLRGRVMALWAAAFMGGRPFAALAVGAVADRVGVRTALAAVGLLTLSGVALLRRRPDPAPPSAAAGRLTSRRATS